MMKNDALLLYEQKDEIAFLKLNRSAKRNAINDELLDALAAFFANPPRDARAVVLHGEGSHFCAGLDLVERMEKFTPHPLDIMRHCRSWHRTFDLIQFGELPVIAVLKNGVIGGGLELAAACHVRVSEASTYYQLPEGQRGIFVGGGASVRVPRIIGAGRMLEMMLTGRSYRATEGLQLGLAHYLVPDGEGLSKAVELAAAIAANEPASNFSIINAIPRIAEMSTADGLFAESMAATMTAAAGDPKGRIAAFFEQRRNGRAD